MDNEIKDMLFKLLEGQSRLETEVKKNSMELETIGKNIIILAKVQTTYKELHDFSFKNTKELIDKKTDLIGIANLEDYLNKNPKIKLKEEVIINWEYKKISGCNQ